MTSESKSSRMMFRKVKLRNELFELLQPREERCLKEMALSVAKEAEDVEKQIGRVQTRMLEVLYVAAPKLVAAEEMPLERQHALTAQFKKMGSDLRATAINLDRISRTAKEYANSVSRPVPKAGAQGDERPLAGHVEELIADITSLRNWRNEAVQKWPGNLPSSVQLSDQEQVLIKLWLLEVDQSELALVRQLWRLKAAYHCDLVSQAWRRTPGHNALLLRMELSRQERLAKKGAAAGAEAAVGAAGAEAAMEAAMEAAEAEEAMEAAGAETGSGGDGALGEAEGEGAAATAASKDDVMDVTSDDGYFDVRKYWVF